MTGHALAMAAAMLPVAAWSSDVVAERALAFRRRRAVALHAAGFAWVWLCFGLAVMPVAMRVNVAACLAVAVAWQLSPLRRRYASRCGRLLVGPPRGWRAERDSLVGGADHGIRCVRTCWASMLAMAAAPHPVLAAAVLAVMLSEWMPGPNPFAARRARRPAALYAALALVSLV